MRSEDGAEQSSTNMCRDFSGGLILGEPSKHESQPFSRQLRDVDGVTS